MLTKIIITVIHNYDISGSVRKNYPKKACLYRIGGQSVSKNLLLTNEIPFSQQIYYRSIAALYFGHYVCFYYLAKTNKKSKTNL